MTDTGKREELIEEARRAIHAAIPGSGDYEDWIEAIPRGLDLLGDMARAAFAVFEQAHTPTDPTWPRTNDYSTPPLTDGQMEQGQQRINDALRAQEQTPTDAQPRKVPHTGPGHASGDAGFCEGCLAERDQNKRGPECIPGEPFTLEDLAREHDNLAAHPTQMSQTIPAFHTLTAKALRWAAALRRTAVQEPSDAFAAIERAKAYLTDASETSEMRNRNAYGALKDITAEPQGEPKHDASCGERCNHCQVCGKGILYGSRCPEHYLNQPQGEPTDAPTVQLAARRGGKVQAMIDSMLAQANERGIRVEVVYPQGEPTDDEITAAVLAWNEARGESDYWDMRAALRAAAAIGQEEKR